MEGIILNTEQECIDLISQIDTSFSFLFQGMTNTYTHYIKHLTLDNYIVIIDKANISHLAAAFPDLFNALPYGLEDVETVLKEDYTNQIDEFI